jgi:hypothetical protein
MKFIYLGGDFLLSSDSLVKTVYPSAVIKMNEVVVLIHFLLIVWRNSILFYLFMQ